MSFVAMTLTILFKILLDRGALFHAWNICSM